jgi:hypothetical protein
MWNYYVRTHTVQQYLILQQFQTKLIKPLFLSHRLPTLQEVRYFKASRMKCHKFQEQNFDRQQKHVYNQTTSTRRMASHEVECGKLVNRENKCPKTSKAKHSNMLSPPTNPYWLVSCHKPWSGTTVYSRQSGCWVISRPWWWRQSQPLKCWLI